MRQHPDGSRTPIIDASVHIFFGSNSDLRSFLPEPFKSRGFSDYEMDWYGAPGGEYAKGTRGSDRTYPGSDPELVARHLFSDHGVDVAVLHPMGRGVMPDRHLGTAVLAATNEMLVSRWL
ncbi:MAG TPA: amidohydrolase, partial [Mycobacterium sp.]|nr:amidohydrolase [Mycobacterium sp.]